MIQRIQTLYLFTVVVLFATILFTPLIEFSKESQLFELSYNGIVSLANKEVIVQTYLLTALECIVLFISLCSIFLYKKRILQIRLAVFNIVLMVGFYALLGVYLYVAKTSVGLEFHFRMPVVFPLVGVILSYLAIRAIGKDEALIRSVNRIR